MAEIMMEQPYKVLVRVDATGCVTAVNSDAFIADTDGWVEIDSGWGDRYHHAQGNYFDKPLMDERGILRYRSYPSADAPSAEVIARYVKDGVEYLILERSQEEMDADWDAMPRPGASVSEVDAAMMELAALAAENAQRLDEQDAALVELAALIAGGVD